jgi:hypothetical protein
MEIGVRVNAIRLLRFFRASRGRVDYAPAIKFPSQPVVDHGHDLEVSNPHRSACARVVTLIDVSLVSLSFKRPQLIQCHLIQALHSWPLRR